MRFSRPPSEPDLRLSPARKRTPPCIRCASRSQHTDEVRTDHKNIARTELAFAASRGEVREKSEWVTITLCSERMIKSVKLF